MRTINFSSVTFYNDAPTLDLEIYLLNCFSTYKNGKPVLFPVNLLQSSNSFHPKMKTNSSFLAWALVLLAIAVVVINAQVNFSPAWGKRAAIIQAKEVERLSQNAPDCRVPLENVAKMLRLIQEEGQRVLARAVCEGLGPDIIE